MRQDAPQFLWKGEFIPSFTLSARTHLSSGASTGSGRAYDLNLNLGSGSYWLCDLRNDFNLTTSSQSVTLAYLGYFELLMK